MSKKSDQKKGEDPQNSDEKPVESSECAMDTDNNSAEVVPALKVEKGIQTSEVRALCDDLIEVSYPELVISRRNDL